MIMKRTLLTEPEIIEVLKAEVAALGHGGITQIARSAKVTPQYISSVANGNGYMSKKLAKYLGYKLIKKREFEKI